MMTVGISRVEREGSFEFRFRSSPIPVVGQMYVGDRVMRICKGVVEFQSLYCRRLRFGLYFVRRLSAYVERDSEQHIAICQAAVGSGIGWILVDCLPKIIHRTFERFPIALHPEIPAFDVQLVCL